MLDTEAWDAATARDRRSRDLYVAQPAFATMKEMRYADELRRQLRARLLRAAAPPTAPWSVGVD
jgi:hypothetical protein